MALTLSRNPGDAIVLIDAEAGLQVKLTVCKRNSAGQTEFLVDYQNGRQEVFAMDKCKDSPKFFDGHIAWDEGRAFAGHQIRVFLDFPKKVSIHRVTKDGTVLQPRGAA